jgi:hypothetical protein
VIILLDYCRAYEEKLLPNSFSSTQAHANKAATPYCGRLMDFVLPLVNRDERPRRRIAFS